jgi:hypothetical protein
MKCSAIHSNYLNVVLQFSLKQFSRPVQPGFNGSRGTVQHFGDGFIRQFLHFFHYESGSVFLGQGPNGVSQNPAAFLSQDLITWAAPGIRYFKLAPFFVPWLPAAHNVSIKHLTAPLPVSELIDGQVGRDSIYPGGKLVQVAVSVDAPIDPEKSLLAQIRGNVVVAHHHIQIIDYRIFIPGDKLRKSLVISGYKFAHQTIVCDSSALSEINVKASHPYGFFPNSRTQNLSSGNNTRIFS